MVYVVNWWRRTWADSGNAFAAMQRQDNRRFAAVWVAPSLDAAAGYLNREAEGIQVLDAATYATRFVAVVGGTS